MTRTNLRRAGASVAAVALITAIAVSAQQSAQAYPPGTKLSLVANRASVGVSQKVTLSVFHAGPGCSVKFTFGSQHAFETAHDGKAAATFKSTATHGTIKAEAQTYNCSFTEKAFTSVEAQSPSIQLPGHVAKNHSFRLTIYHFPALSHVKIRIYNGHFSKTILVKTGSGGTAHPLFKVPNAGSYLVVASGGDAFASAVLHVDNK